MQTVHLEWKGEFRFEGRADEARTAIDGDGQVGPSPVNLLLESVGACTAIDVVDILQKGRQEIRAMSVEVGAERRDEVPRAVTALFLRFRIEGDVAKARAQRAVDLSLEKYCSVFHSLRMDVSVDTELEIIP
ncbi:MAG: OsmC family protein [marine benthic group bacterium]|jgi:putative redox protein|nr:OsmC family protein [Gemmatimonadota bacterium]MCL7937876.1 OsmC family protein [Gemmatimonadota bacterium]MCL7978997.1 OsmC family protein [Gemmatimonadota bacterium]